MADYTLTLDDFANDTDDRLESALLSLVTEDGVCCLITRGMPETPVYLDGDNTPFQSAGTICLDVIRWQQNQVGRDCFAPLHVIDETGNIGDISYDDDGSAVGVHWTDEYVTVDLPDLSDALDNADAFLAAAEYVGEDGDWSELREQFGRLIGLRNEIDGNGECYSGRRAGEMAEEWDANGLTDEAPDWMQAKFWDPASARRVKNLGLTPERARELADEMLSGVEDPDTLYTDGDPIYAICNNDLDAEALVTRYRVYDAPEGCDLSFCGEYVTLQEAQSAADDEPEGLPKSLWDTARAAGHCGGQRAPEGGIEDDEPISWHGDQHCVVEVKLVEPSQS